ncbi:MAG: D-alanyl-D-alanine carboxypeptidase [Bradyrhizobiaceae bacterium]|nr:D-alanyl-D-alanine carboxypeptidase [Bradyrhizobiaceae bacterium]
MQKLPFCLRLPSCALLLVVAVCVLAVGAGRQARAEARLLVEVESGKVLEAEDATIPWYPASVTKLTTLYVTLKALKAGRITLDTLFSVSPNAAAQEPAKMGFPIGTKVTVDNAMKMMMVKSANDMAVLLAEGVSGSIEKFADEMNDVARELGMTETSYVNPNGLPAEGQITSARDLAILARALIREFPEYDLYWHIPAIKFGRRVMRNFNPLIDRYPGADGMKTGFICASGYNLVATATRNDKRLIAVVLGAPSATARMIHAAQLLERGFNGETLTWLTPAPGTVEELKPMQASPPDLHDTICAKHPHKKGKPRAENEEADASELSDPAVQAFMLSNLRGSNLKPGSLLSPSLPSMPPIVVFTGPPKSGAKTQIATKTFQNALSAAKSGETAAGMSLNKHSGTVFGPSTEAFEPATSDSIPLPRPRPKIAKVKSAKR